MGKLKHVLYGLAATALSVAVIFMVARRLPAGAKAFFQVS